VDPAVEKEFCIGNDGTYVAVGCAADLDGPDTTHVRVIRVADERRFDIPRATYDFGGRRLAVDDRTRTLFSGAYFTTGIAAYGIETGTMLWHRRDLKKVQRLAFDPRDGVLYCAFDEAGAKPLNASDGRERKAIRGLKRIHFSPDGGIAIFESKEVRLENRGAGTAHVLARESFASLHAAFLPDRVIVSWAGGPVICYGASDGDVLWRYSPEGTHAFDLAVSSDQSSVWVAEQPYKNPPRHRLRMFSPEGTITREIRCVLGVGYKLIPFRDCVIRADMSFARINDLSSEPNEPRP
jgi:hypothetical protein